MCIITWFAKERARECGIVIETAEAREVHHFALLTAYGAGAVNPYLALATLDDLLASRYLPETFTHKQLQKNYLKASVKGVLKVMSKMGISTQQSYRGAQIFEAVGLNTTFVNEYFCWTPSRIQGVGLHEIAEESLRRHEHAYPRREVPEVLDLDVGGQYQWRRKGEAHIMNPDVVAKLQHATQINSRAEFKQLLQADRRTANAAAHVARSARISQRHATDSAG